MIVTVMAFTEKYFNDKVVFHGDIGDREICILNQVARIWVEKDNPNSVMVHTRSLENEFEILHGADKLTIKGVCFV